MTIRLKLGLSLVFLFLLALASCVQNAAPLPLPDQKAGVWVEFAGDTDTSCANASAFKYFVNKGTVDKVVIDFQGGGACFDDASCLASYSSGVATPLYADTIITKTSDLNQGIYDHTNAANPVKDWYHVMVPYCTGDLHMGDNSKTYTNPSNQEPYTIQHKGAVNAKSVLDWTFKTFKSPDAVFITGCSAGAYGAAFWTDTIKTEYKDVNVYQLGDCGVGAATDGFAAFATGNWNSSSVFPGTTFDANFVNSTYIATANKFKNSLNMAQYNTLFDNTQVQFYALITGQTDPANGAQVAAEWSDIMQKSVAKIDAETTNFNSYLAQGSQHCIIPSNDFYTRAENGTKLVDWLTDYLAGKTVPNVKPVTP